MSRSVLATITSVVPAATRAITNMAVDLVATTSRCQNDNGGCNAISPVAEGTPTLGLMATLTRRDATKPRQTGTACTMTQLRQIQDQANQCSRCGYRWHSRTERPRQCPQCKSPRWQSDRPLLRSVRTSLSQDDYEAMNLAAHYRNLTPQQFVAKAIVNETRVVMQQVQEESREE